MGAHLKCANEMKHTDIRWNPSTREWFCTSCGRTSNVETEHDARTSLDQYECTIPSVEVSRSVPGTETKRLMRKPYKMTLKTERSGSRFVAAHTADGSPSIRLELFHDSVPSLKTSHRRIRSAERNHTRTIEGTVGCDERTDRRHHRHAERERPQLAVLSAFRPGSSARRCIFDDFRNQDCAATYRSRLKTPYSLVGTIPYHRGHSCRHKSGSIRN